MIRLKEVEVEISTIIPARCRLGYKFTEWKVQRAMKIFEPGGEGFVGALKGRYLPDGRIELAAGHNRLEAMKRLGIKKVPVQIFEMSDAEFFDMYTKDNSAEDTQVTAWALTTVESAPAMLGETFSTQSEMYAHVAGLMGRTSEDIKHFREMNAALAGKKLVSEIVDVTNIDLALYTWRKFKKFGIERIPRIRQENLLEEVKEKDRENGGRRVRIVVKAWEAEVPSAPKLTPEKEKGELSLRTLANTVIDAINEMVKRPGDLTPEIKNAVLEAADLLRRLDSSLTVIEDNPVEVSDEELKACVVMEEFGEEQETVNQ